MTEMASMANVGVVFVEFHSDGLVAQRAAELMGWGCSIVVSDNSGCYVGPGTIVDTGGNIGFGPACNVGVAALPPHVDVVVLHNPDARIDANDLIELAGAVRSGWAAVAPALSPDGVRTRPHGFAVPGLGRELLLTMREAVGSRRFRRHPRTPATAKPVVALAGEVVARPGRFGSAALLVLDRSAFAAVEGFDEDYFLYAEDLDLWHRMQVAGFRVGFIPSVLAHHEGAAGSPASAARRVALRWLGRELFAQRAGRHPRWVRMIHRVGVALLPRGDEVVDTVRAGFARGRSAADLNEQIRRTSDPPPAQQ